MARLSEAERLRIRAAIGAAEAKTAGEFAVVIARASDHYLTLPVLIAAVAAFCVPGALWYGGLVEEFPWLYGAQLGTFIVLTALLTWPPVTRLIVPRAVSQHRVARRAHELFHVLELHRAQGESGVLLFVSLAERRVEIMADRGIHQRVPAGTWDAIVADFTRQCAQGRIADALVAAVEALGNYLGEHFPRPPGHAGKLPERLIEL